jgi:hypothetical protein
MLTGMYMGKASSGYVRNKNFSEYLRISFLEKLREALQKMFLAENIYLAGPRNHHAPRYCLALQFLTHFFRKRGQIRMPQLT